MNITFKQASAGSGKTTSIEHAVSDLLSGGALKAENLMVVTFTVAAANELKGRIGARLLKKGLTDCAMGLNKARIGTVHSVCGQLLVDFAFELGLPPRLRVIEDRDKTLLLSEALDNSLTVAETQILNRLSEALSIKDQNFQINWKSELLAIVEQARLNNIASTHLPLSADQSVQGFINNLPTEDSSISEARLRTELQNAKVSGAAYPKPTKGFATSLETIDRLLAQRTLTYEDWVRISKLKAGVKEVHLLNDVRECGSSVLRCPDFRRDAENLIRALFHAAERVMSRFAELKAQRGLVDFVDQEKLTFDALDNPIVRQRLGNQIKYLIVDEFQDTSPLQLALFSKLSGVVDNMLLVGDAKQSIYGFRGADPRLALDVIKYVQAGGGKLETLGNCYRSRPGLVHLSNNLFTSAFSHILTPDQVQLTPQVSYTLPSPELSWWQLNGSRQELRASALATGLHSLRASNAQVWDKRMREARDADWRDMAVLCRSNTEAQKLADACVAQGIPVALSRAGLIETPEVLLALACLRRLADPGDSLSSADILSFATGSNAESWLASRIDAVHAGDQRAWDDAANPILTRLAGARNDIGALSPVEALALAMQVADIHQIVLGWDESTRLTEHRLANLQQLKTLAIEYQDHCKANHVAGTAAGFLLWLRALEQGFTDDQAPNPGNAVTIATYHKAKGLEWPIVVCASLDASLKVSLYGVRVTTASSQFDWNAPLAGRDLVYWPNPFPNQKGKDPLTERLQQTPEWQAAAQQARNEGIQLLYVGMTRARDQLILTQENNKEIGEWLGLLDTSFFPLTGGTLGLPSGHSAETATLTLSAPDTPSPNAGLRARYWLPQCTGPATGTTPYFRPPSGEEASTALSCIIDEDFGWRLTLSGNQDMEQVGVALHHCLAIVLANPTVSCETITRILQQYPAVCLDAGEILKRGHDLLDWVVRKFPNTRIHTELPVSRHLDTGQLQSGRIDFALETDDSWIIVDHKSNPQPASEWEEIAGKHSGQIGAYCDALAKLSGKPVSKSFVHFSVAGGMIEACR